MADEKSVAVFKQCMLAYPDQARVARLLQCQLDAEQAEQVCYSACPADAEPCADAGNQAIMACTDPDLQTATRACLTANK